MFEPCIPHFSTHKSVWAQPLDYLTKRKLQWVLFGLKLFRLLHSAPSTRRPKWQQIDEVKQYNCFFSHTLESKHVEMKFFEPLFFFFFTHLFSKLETNKGHMRSAGIGKEIHKILHNAEIRICKEHFLFRLLDKKIKWVLFRLKLSKIAFHTSLNVKKHHVLTNLTPKSISS